jgi:hypothetical protein
MGPRTQALLARFNQRELVMHGPESRLQPVRKGLFGGGGMNRPVKV